MIALIGLTLTCAQKLDSLFLEKAYQGINFGAVVMDKSGNVLYEHNADARLTPASNMKVLTHVYAFSVLGKDWRPKTRFWKDGNDVIVDAVGDPTISSAQLREVVGKLGVLAPYKIKVHAAFKGGYPDGWKPDDYQYKYGTPVYAFSVDRANMSVYAQNHALETLPDTLGITVKRGSTKGKLDVRYNFWARVLVVTGALPEGRKAITEITAPDPAAHACFVMGGTPAGTADLPARAPDAVIEGKTLSELACECLRPSDNTMAEEILQMAAHEDVARTGKSSYDMDPSANDPFSWAGTSLQDFYWEKLGVPRGDVRVFDGSGLSRRDLVTSRALAKALQFAWTQPFRYDFVNALPRAGINGTMKNRLKGLPVSAKTGSLNNVAALSGYVYPDTEDPLIFAVIGNTNGRPASLVRQLADKLVTELAAERSRNAGKGSSGGLESAVPLPGYGAIARNRLR